MCQEKSQACPFPVPAKPKLSVCGEQLLKAQLRPRAHNCCCFDLGHVALPWSYLAPSSSSKQKEEDTEYLSQHRFNFLGSYKITKSDGLAVRARHLVRWNVKTDFSTYQHRYQTVSEHCRMQGFLQVRKQMQKQIDPGRPKGWVNASQKPRAPGLGRTPHSWVGHM